MDTPVTGVVSEIEAATRYRFLYRDALISHVKVSFVSEAPNVLDSLGLALLHYGIRLQVDHDRGMVFVLPKSGRAASASRIIRGTVSDARTLERLPYATVSWNRGRGVVCDEGGRFLLDVSPSEGLMQLVFSYLGFVPDTLALDPSSLPRDLAIKLRPLLVVGSEVVVSSSLLSSNLDSTWYHLLRSSLATPAGEHSISRSLQLLPSVGITTGVSSGLNVRGSRADGFQILLDGIPIYSQSHLFGMFDAFNPDALQTVAFYYAIAPARFQAPPGGTLSYLTRTGSKQGFRSRVGVTTTAASATIEGPAGVGRGSWIVSARKSYLDNVDWFNNDGLIEMGLGVSRDNSGTRRLPLDERTLVAESPSATFYDVHAKFEYESKSGSTFHISGYLGGDRARQDGERIVALNPISQDPRVRTTVTTSNDWGNSAISIHYRSSVRVRGYSHSYVGFSRYRGSFRKDDFFYRAPQAGSADLQFLFAPFLNDNRLTEIRVVNESSVSPRPTLHASLGFSGQRLVSIYNELSALRREFESNQQAWQLDLFSEVTKRFNDFSATIGIRPHYFSSGSYLRVSPRLSFSAFGHSPVSVAAGYTRNYQFTHRLYVENAATTDIWVLSNQEERPGAVDHATASILYRGRGTTAQIEGFLKWQQHLRRHETIFRPGSGLHGGAILLSPWTSDNDARARGLEALLSKRLGSTQLTATYSLSRVQISHPDVGDGAFFLADWDRTHQALFHGQAELSKTLSASLAWTIASGQPNAYAYINTSEPRRHPPYYRVDAAIHYSGDVHGATMNAFIRFFNLFDTQNVWYRTAETVLQGRGQNLRLGFEPVDVYDLGFQPSLGLSLTF